jgi:hypothetical protein
VGLQVRAHQRKMKQDWRRGLSHVPAITHDCWYSRLAPEVLLASFALSLAFFCAFLMAAPSSFRSRRGVTPSTRPRS